MSPYVFGAVASLILIAFDRFTKSLATQHLADGPVNIINNVFELRLLTNRGAAFGMFEGGRWLLVLLTAAILVVVVRLYIKMPFGNEDGGALGVRKTRILYRVSYVLIVSGGLANLIDRAFSGFVVDFFYFKLINFPVFNMADIYVVLGSMMFIVLLTFFSGKTEDES